MGLDDAVETLYVKGSLMRNLSTEEKSLLIDLWQAELESSG